jgi:hypothetical protein
MLRKRSPSVPAGTPGEIDAWAKVIRASSLKTQ